MDRYSIQKTPFSILRDLARKHKTIRKSSGMSQNELANRSGVSLGSIKRFESTGKISMKSFLKLLAILGRLEEMDAILLQEENLEAIEKLFSDNMRK